MKPLFDKVTIIGVGLIGGSMGLAMRGWSLANQVTGVDTDQANLELALELEAVHRISQNILEAVADVDLVVMATPVGLTPDLVALIAPHLQKGCIVTDVGSTKADVVTKIEQLMPPGTCFIGGHPMTGAETAGVQGADRYLFENAVYILTPSKKTDMKALTKIKSLINGLGARCIELDPQEHDIMVAAVSHLPHLVATALVNTASELDQEHHGLLMLAAGGFRDTTRIASGNPLMWKDICLTNKESILMVLDKFAATLERARALVEECDDLGLKDEFEQARELRKNIPAKIKGYLPQTFEIVVTVPDKPGIIGNLAFLLGNEGININDIEILRVREGEGGTIRLAFGSEENQARAVDTLRQNGITVKKR